MKVSLNEVKRHFDLLISETKSIEEISNWALNLQTAHDQAELEYFPLSAKDKILDGIIYLVGVDLLDIDGSYLHTKEDFIEFINYLLPNYQISQKEAEEEVCFFSKEESD